jgi:hypothetical protein
MERDFLHPASPDRQSNEAKAEASLPVTTTTPLQPGEASPEEAACAEEEESRGCQSQVLDPVEPPVITPGVTLAKLAETLKLPKALLEKQGLTERKKEGLQAIRIPYFDPQGNPLSVRWLVNLQGNQDGTFERRQGDKPALYGLWNLGEIQETGEVVLVDSLFDFWVCQHYEIRALSLPEGNNWRAEWSQYLSGLIVCIWEKDAPVLVPRLASTVPDIAIMRMPVNINTLTEAHLQGTDILDLLIQCADQSVSARDLQQTQANDLIGKLKKEAASILSAADPVQVVRAGLQDLGYGGDLNSPLITYLALTSRVLAMRQGAMPVHLLLLGQPSSGKSYCLQVVLLLMPPDTYNKIDAGSPKVFIYDNFDYQHRVAIFSEADSLPAGEDNPAASAIRNMLQDHSLHYHVTESDPETGKFVVREIKKPGPTVLVTTAVKRLGTQLDTRLFSLEVPDDLAQTQAALDKQADIELTGVPKPDPALIAYQAYIQALAPWQVLVPFAKKLAHEIGRLPNASRITRDYARLISLIKSVAVLRHGKRQRDDQGRLIAEIEDYALVHELVGKMYEISVTRLSNKIRDLVRAVGELRGADVWPVSQTKVAEHLGCAKQAITEAVKTALEQGWLANHETKPGYPFKLTVGEPLPEALGLPDPGLLREDLGEPYKDSLTEAVEPQAPVISPNPAGCQAVRSMPREIF